MVLLRFKRKVIGLFRRPVAPKPKPVIRKPKFPVRGSKRVSIQRLSGLTPLLHPTVRPGFEKALKSGQVWNAVRETYGSRNPHNARKLVSPGLYPRPRHESTNQIKRNGNVNQYFRHALKTRSLVNIVMPVAGGNRGGVNPGYAANAYHRNPIRYAIVNKRGEMKGFALLKNRANGSRYIDVIAGPGVGHQLMNKVLANARASGKVRVNLSAVSRNDPNVNALVQWYKGKGFVITGARNSNGLVPMSRRF